MVRLGLAIVLGALVGLAGDRPSSVLRAEEKKASPLVGRWEASEPAAKGLTLVLVFTADGKFTREAVLDNPPKGGNVKIDGGKQEGLYQHADKTITLRAAEGESKLTIKELTDTKLTLVNPQGKELTFTKKK
jgi:uncharacterized protein (TIGR03066 family)